MKKIKQAYKIAKKELRECYEKHGIVAGRHHFSDYWGRDGFFASLGAIEIGDVDVVKKMVELFYAHQNSKGLIPYRLMNGPVTLAKYLGKDTKKFEHPRPTYRLREVFQEVFDGTTLAIVILSELGLKGHKITNGRLEQTKKAFSYLEKKEKHGLLWDGIMAEWNDTANKFGNLLYTNIIYWRALDRFNLLLKKLKRKDKSLVDKQKNVGQAIKNRLWNGEHFADWNDYKRHDYFYPFGNFLAIAWGFTTKKESDSIIKFADKVKIRFTLETNYPKYPFWRVDLFQHLIGMGDYQNMSTLWWQPVTAYIVALNKLGKKKEAIKQLELMSEQVLEHKGIYECYDRQGKPMNRLMYKSEHPFAWSSGLFIWAVKSL
ncbi:MAG: amylo-alpha-1,6-glucosidase [Nanoarchaeota archaeon]